MDGRADSVLGRVLLLAPHGRDAEVASSLLERSALQARICRELGELVGALEEGADLALVAEEALARGDPRLLLEWVAGQPPWSDLPFIILTMGGETYTRPARLATTIAQLRNATLLERPLHTATLLSAVRSGLRARSRQYEVRRHLQELERATRELRAFNETLEARVAERTRALAEANRRLIGEIEEHRRTEEALRQAQKMQAVGELTGGLAHDFNNMLTVIGANLDLLEARASGAPELRRLAEAAAHGVERAATLTHQLLAFSRKQRLDPRPIDLNAVIAGMSDLLRRTVGDSVEIRTRLSADLRPALADPNQVEMVLLNLVLNARDALAERGTVEIATRNVRLPLEGAASAHTDAPRYVELCVSDTGCGMSRDVVERAFEPFFTTKEVGKGSGLGLSMVYGFVRQSNGQIRLESEVGRGTTVRVYLPEAGSEPVVEPASSSTTLGVRAEGSRGGTALVVEDNDAVREVAVAALVDFGYDVLEAANAAAALELLASGREFELVFTDAIMPGAMSGIDLAKTLSECRPQIAVVLTSGYAERLTTSGNLPNGTVFLNKPYRPADLLEAVRTALAQRRS